MDKLHANTRLLFTALGMVKWTPDISAYPSVGSTAWHDFTSRVWYGELEFFFTTSCGLVLSVFMYYGRTAEENDNAEAIQGEQMSVDDAFYLNEVRLLEGGFDSQFHLACYYCYCHLKLQEIRNLTWICECIVQKQRGKIEKYIPIFSPNAAWRHGKLGI